MPIVKHLSLFNKMRNMPYSINFQGAKSDSEDVENGTICDTQPPSECESANTTATMQPHMPYAIPNTPTQWTMQASPVTPRTSPMPIKGYLS